MHPEEKAKELILLFGDNKSARLCASKIKEELLDETPKKFQSSMISYWDAVYKNIN